MRIGSLCSGAGGLDMAVEQVFGAEAVWHCEINDAASKVLAHRWPGIPNHRDLTTVDWDQVEPVDILTGGYPCQPFSHAGQRKGTDDERHIWPSVREAIRRVRPRVTVLENVAGHRSLGFDRVLGDLAEDGMHVRWTSLRASDVGAPHQRERLFIVVTDPARGSGPNELWRRDPTGFPCSTISGTGNRDSGREAAPRVRELGGTSRELAAVTLLPTPRASDHFGPGEHGEVGLDLRTAVALLPTPTTEPQTGNGHARNLGAEVKQWGKYSAAIHRWEAITRPHPPPMAVAPNGTVERLNPAFSEWMQGWPAGWVTDLIAARSAETTISRSDAHTIIGNGVVTLQAVVALQWLLGVCEAAA